MHAATTDRLSAFLDLLAETLDGEGGAPEAIAARLHLSRFTVDRLVAAAVGEPPGRLRRRILLERAAHRLLTTDSDLLDVSLDAGYGSHEAFTRAFARAFGEAPSRWRRTPSSFRIGPAERVHFKPPGGLSLPAEGRMNGMDLITRMVEHHVFVVGQMVDRAAALDCATLDRPIELSVEGVDDNPTLRSLLSRLVGQMAMWNASTDDRQYDFAVERHESVASMRERLAVEGPTFLERVRTTADQGRFDQTFVDATCDPTREFTYGGMVAHVLTYAAHRRTLVAGALWAEGIRDVEADPMRWVAQAG